MTDLKSIDDAIMSLNENDLLHVVLFGNKNFDSNMNVSILTATIKFIKDSEKFDQSLFLSIITTILIASSIHFLNFLCKNSVVLQLDFSPNIL